MYLEPLFSKLAYGSVWPLGGTVEQMAGDKERPGYSLCVPGSILWGPSFCRTGPPCFYLSSEGVALCSTDTDFPYCAPRPNRSSLRRLTSLWMLSLSPVWLLSSFIVCVTISLSEVPSVCLVWPCFMQLSKSLSPEMHPFQPLINAWNPFVSFHHEIEGLRGK